MTVEEIIRAVPPADESARREALERWNTLAKPLRSLGALEDIVAQMAAVRGGMEVRLQNRRLLVLCADNGVTAQGVSQSDATVTSAVAAALGQGRSTVNHMAAAASCEVIPIDIGMAGQTPPGVVCRKLQKGTADISQGPAMSRETCLKAVSLGAELAREQAETGADILLLGEMGIGNTTTSAAVASVLLDLPPERLTGRGAGLSDAGLRRKIEVISQAIAVNRPNSQDPIDVLQKVGGLDLAALCGICLGGALYRIPVLLDGVITAAAALCALRLCPAVRDVLIAFHLSSEPAAARLLEALGLRPIITAGLHLGEGSGAVLALPLLDQALAVYHSGHTFDKLGIDAYTPQ